MFERLALHQMRGARWQFAAALALALGACGGLQPVTPAPDTTTDAGTLPGQQHDDAGSLGAQDAADPQPDAGAPSDSDAAVTNHEPDAGGQPPEADAGVPPEADAGTNSEPDAGSNSGGYHPDGWATPGSANFHGTAALQGLSTCQGCHGATLEGGAMSCNTCHNGWKTNCTFCHGGTGSTSGAPPRDVQGRTATTEVTVGAHSSHLQATLHLAAPVTCDSCHTVPTDALSAGHIDASPAEVKITGWNRTSATCASTYCHGNFTGGKTTNAPHWTAVGSGQAACGTCHDLSPRTGHHPSNFSSHSFMGKDCGYCHDGITNSTATAITNTALHMNGTKDVAIRGGRWDAATKTCYPSCHGSKRW